MSFIVIQAQSIWPIREQFNISSKLLGKSISEGTRWSCLLSLALYKDMPQGSVLRPLLFIISLGNDLPLLPTNSNINSYADDTQLFLHGLNPITTQTTLQSDLTLLSDWLHADIIEKLNESILRFVFNDFKNSYEKLLQEIKQPSLRARRINDMLILVF